MRKLFERLLDAAKDQRNPSRELVHAIMLADRYVERTLERLVAKGRLPGIKLKGDRRVSPHSDRRAGGSGSGLVGGGQIRSDGVRFKDPTQDRHLGSGSDLASEGFWGSGSA